MTAPRAMMSARVTIAASEAAEVGEAVERDEPPRGRASPWQREDQPGRIETVKSLRQLGASILARVTMPATPDRSPNGSPEGYSRGSPPAAGADRQVADLLGAIAEDVARDTAAATHAIMQEFTGKIAQARHLPRNQRRAAIAAFKRDRKAAIAAVKAKATIELAARRKAVRELHGWPKRGGTDIAPTPK